jgi:hypothetical protein
MIGVALIDRVALHAEELVHEAKRRLPHLAHADLRLEVTEGKYATAENGGAKASGDDYGLALGVRVLAGAQGGSEERPRRLLLNMSARVGPGGQQHRVCQGLAQPRSARRGIAWMVGEALPRRGARPEVAASALITWGD